MTLPLVVLAQKPSPAPVVLEIEGKVEVLVAGSNTWTLAKTNQVLRPNDQLRTARNSRAALRWSNLNIYRVGGGTTIRIPEPQRDSNALELLKGFLYFFHRDRPGEHPLRTPTAYAVVLGTEFGVEVREDGTTLFALLDGRVSLRNDNGELTITNGQAAIIGAGQKPDLLPAIQVQDTIQWALYYPAVLDPAELTFPAERQQLLANSLHAYSQGDVMAALSALPTNQLPASISGDAFRAGLLLAVGEVETADSLLRAQPDDALAAALRRMKAAVQFRALPPEDVLRTNSASSWLAESYYQQSRKKLPAARAAAWQAVSLSPQFSFGWARVAEMEFSFGNNDAAYRAIQTSLRLGPRNAQAKVLEGFLLASKNRWGPAQSSFQEAINLNGALGNAWLGRGLIRLRRGETDPGRADLQMAAVLEPQRALFRSYLGKAFAENFDDARAREELRRARELDPGDPTAWLYSALLENRTHQINEAVRDLETSQDLNDNRSLYRSELLLDQDRAARGANLAQVFDDAGMIDVSVREAARAVASDYANHSAHLFLANSYDELRDPRQVNLRYETPWLSEYLVAHLLAPVGAGTLSQEITAHEFARLFEKDGFGFASSTEYRSRGDWVQSASQFGRFKNSAYAIDLTYRSENGHRVNNDLEQLTLSAKFQQQLTPQDSFYLQGIYYDASSGDVNHYYNQAEANPEVRIQENQEPILLAGFHHEWAPGTHSLLLVGRLQDTLRVSNPQQDTFVFGRGLGGEVTDVLPIEIEQNYRSELEIYTAEGQQIWQGPQHSVVAGLRFQQGEVDIRNRHADATFIFPFLFAPRVQSTSEEFQRFNAYVYHHWQVAPPLLLVAGLSYDRLIFPENFRYAPLAADTETESHISPKAGFVWTPGKRSTIRAAYAEAVGGMSFDQSFQLEPTQVAGFNQAFRSLIPESVAGANAGERYKTAHLSLEHKLGRATYLGLGGEVLRSEADRTLGVFDFVPFVVTPALTRQKMDFEEQTIVATVNQLLGDEWSIGLRYRLSRAELDTQFPEIPTGANAPAGFERESDLEATLHQVKLYALYNHRGGFFAQVDSLWNAQSNRGYNPDRPGDDFWQFNVMAGYRFFHRRLELRTGILNLTDQDFRLNPLNLTPDLPRDRTFVASLRFFF